MEGITNQTAYQILGAVANGMTGVQLPAAGEEKDAGKFQELMDKAKSGQPDSAAEEQPKTQKPAAAKTKKEAPVQKQEEDPVETVKKAQMVVVGHLEPEVVLEPVTVENPETGEDITIAVGDWEPQVWAYQSTPEEIAGEPYPVDKDFRTVDVSAPAPDRNPNPTPAPVTDAAPETDAAPAPEIDAVPAPETDAAPAPKTDTALEAADPDEDNSSAAVPEKVTVEQFDREVQQTAEKVKPQVKPQAEPQVQQQQEETGEITVEYGEVKPEPVFHDVEAAPVKVSDTAQVRETEETPDVDRQLDSRLTQALLQGETRVELQLTPEHLGAVKVEITRTAEGTLHVSLSTQNGQTRTLLEKHASDLQNSLGARTQDQVRVEVNKQEESQRRDQNPYEGHNGQGQQQEHHRRQRQAHSGEDFLQQLRLGLIPVEE